MHRLLLKVKAFGISILYILFHGLLYNLLNVAGGSFGLSIIIVTIIIRLIILPLMIKQIKSSKAMQVDTARIKSIKREIQFKGSKNSRKVATRDDAIISKAQY